MALSIGFRILSLLPSCYSSYGVLNSYPDGTFTHCSCQPSLDAHLPGPILPPPVDSPSGRPHAQRLRENNALKIVASPRPVFQCSGRRRRSSSIQLTTTTRWSARIAWTE